MPSHQEVITNHAIEDDQNNQPDTQDDDMGTAEDVTHQEELTEGSTNQDNVVDDVSSSSNEDTQAAPEHRYKLRNRDNIDYRSMHRFGETQLMQVQ